MSELRRALIPAAALLAMVACAPREEAPEPAPEPMTEPAAEATAPPLVAMATLAPRSDSTAHGVVMFTQTDGGVSIVAHIEGAPEGNHGLHVHETGDCSAADFTSAGGHFNPTGAMHGGPNDVEHHAGDLGNVTIGSDGSGHLELDSSMLTVAPGPNSVIGHAVILHELADDLVSQPTGDAGGRIACGVIAAKADSGSGYEEGEPMQGMDDEGEMDDEGPSDAR